MALAIAGHNHDMDITNRIVLNVGGTRFETYKTILKKIPATRLSRLTEALVNYDPICNEYFFDRHPGVFSQILNYYRTGKLHYPTNVCGPLFESELEFWGLDSNQVEPCCWKTYTKHRTTEETLSTLDRLNIDVEKTPQQDLDIKFGLDRYPGYRTGNLPLFKRLQPIIWQLFEEPRSSKAATCIAIIQISMIILSVAILWISTFPFSSYHQIEIFTKTTLQSIRLTKLQTHPSLLILEYISLSWFWIEILVRFIVSPSKKAYLSSFNNLFNITASIMALLNPLFHWFLSPYISYDLLQSLQVLRVFRLFRLFTYHPGLRVITLSISNSVSILSLLVFFLFVASVIFGSLIFYAERSTTSSKDNSNKENNIFTSAIEGFWYSVVSLTTIGYGDIAPNTFLGRLIGSVCVVIGVLMVNLPMSIIVEILTNFYKQLGARAKMPKQRRRILPIQLPRGRKMTGQQLYSNFSSSGFRSSLKPNFK